MPISIALLVCDSPGPHVGPYFPIFKEFLSASLPSNAPDFTLDPFDVVTKQEYPPEDKEYDAVLLTGSAASAYENLEWINKLIAYVAELPTKRPQTKIFGICFGHQIIGRAFGGECVPNGGKWEIGITEVQLNDVGKAIFGQSSLNIQQMHRDHVPTVPETFELLGSTSVSYNQGMVRFASSEAPGSRNRDLTNIQILTVQGHPEFTKAISSAIIAVRAQSGVIDQPTVEDAARRTDWRNDGVSVIGRAMWRILGISDANKADL